MLNAAPFQLIDMFTTTAKEYVLVHEYEREVFWTTVYRYRGTLQTGCESYFIHFTQVTSLSQAESSDDADHPRHRGWRPWTHSFEGR